MTKDPSKVYIVCRRVGLGPDPICRNLSYLLILQKSWDFDKIKIFRVRDIEIHGGHVHINRKFTQFLIDIWLRDHIRGTAGHSYSCDNVSCDEIE